MKKYIFLLNFMVFLVSCNDEKKNNSEKAISEESNVNKMEDEGIYSDSDQENQYDRGSANDMDEKNSAEGFAGLYQKVESGTGSQNCNCYCLDLVFGSNFEVCLVPEKIDISVVSRKTGNNTADLFLVAPIRSQIQEEEIPWDTFGRDIPIAKLEYLSDGSLKLDWIGFSVDGELAVDYAIFGKKTLEGTYKKRGS